MKPRMGLLPYEDGPRGRQPPWVGALVVKFEDHEAEIERLRGLLKLIAETPEPRDTIQVWAWQAYKEGLPE